MNRLRALIACCFACLLLAVAGGVLAALFYFEGPARWLHAAGVRMSAARPLHTTFASAWIFLGAVTCIHHWLLETFGEPTAGERRRFAVMLLCWGAAGLGALVTLPLGITSGREYLGFHPAFSALILAGWLAFLWSFLARARRGFWERPVYVYMWASGALFFVYTFVEGHAYLLPALREHPVVDLQIQWKSCGSLVAAFNQMVYGCLLYLGEKLSGDERTAHSRTAFALFGIGLLNSFTNFAHHTYHLPQSHAIKWIAFGASMLEIVLLVRVFGDVVAAARKRRAPEAPYDPTTHLLGLSKRWNLVLLSLAILISVPSLNALIHGTHVVMAHAMVSEVAIDSYILLALFGWLLAGLHPERIAELRRARGALRLLDVALIGVFVVLLAGGLTTGLCRYLGWPEPAWLAHFPAGLALSGSLLGLGLLRLVWLWGGLLLPARRPAAEGMAEALAD